MKELNLYGLRILGIDTIWEKRASFKKRLIVLVGELTEEELYLVKSICFSINFSHYEMQTFIVKSLNVEVPVKVAEPENKIPLLEPVKVPLFVKDPPSAKVSVLLPLMVNVAPELIVTSAAFADAPIAGE